MELPYEYIERADERLETAGFFDKSLAELDLPEVSYARNGDRDSVAYQVHGDIHAPNVILESTTFFTYLRNPHETLRVSAKQTALGDDYAIVAVDAYDPSSHFTHEDRKQMAKGSFAPLSQRQLAVLGDLDVGYECQKLMTYGHSMAGDIALQTAHDTKFNPNRGAYNIEAVGANDMARSVNRGLRRVAQAMKNSGDGLVGNILNSDMPALNEAWGIADKAKAEKVVSSHVNLSVVGYIANGPRNNLAMGHGFGTDQSTQQASDLIRYAELPLLIGRQKRSTVCPITVFPTLLVHDSLVERAEGDKSRLTLLEEDNDHSADDNVRLAAARVLYFASLAAA